MNTSILGCFLSLRVIFFSLFIIFPLCVASYHTRAQQALFEQSTVSNRGLTIEVELARTDEARKMGLMYRSSLCDNCGMLFDFGPPRQVAMWMKNTRIPLDVGYIDENNRLLEVKPLFPFDLTSVASSNPVRYALEMNQGWFEKNNWQPGDVLRIRLPERIKK